jgi:hypothetical protein
MKPALKTIHLLCVLCTLVAFSIRAISDLFPFGHTCGPAEEGILLFGVVLLLFIVSCSAIKDNACSWRVTVPLHCLWIVCFTWFAWFGVDSPFQLDEIVGVDFNNAVAIAAYENRFFYKALAAFLVLLFFQSGVPLWLKWRRPHISSLSK